MRRPHTHLAASVLAACLTGGAFAPTSPAHADAPTAPTPPTGGSRATDQGWAPTRAPRSTVNLDQTVRIGRPATVALAHLAAHADRYHVDASDFEVVDVVTAKHHDSVRLQQTYRGVPVLGAQYVVHTEDAEGGRVVTSTTGTVFSDLSTATTPAVSQDRARARLRLDETVASTVDAQVVPQGLVVLPRANGRLAWGFEVTGTGPVGEPVRQQVYVDAQVGGIALSYTMLDTAATTATGVRDNGEEVTLQVTQTEDGAYELRDQSRAMHAGTGGEILTFDAQGRNYTDYAGTFPEDTPLTRSATDRFDGPATTTGAVDAHLNSGKVYEYLRTVLGRDAVDGEGGTMVSVVNVTQSGREYANAFWDGQKMVYGTYDGVPFSVALDVVGHEMSHGVTEHGSNLLYINQSGAINEALSDYFGNAMEVDDLGMPSNRPEAALLGEHLCRTGTPEDCALRDLNDGRRADQDYRLLAVDYDNGGVHLNSTIAGGALWDIREGIDPHLADRIIHAAQVEYLTPLSGFTDLRRAVELAAAREHASAADRAVIEKAFDDHGVVPGWEETAYTSDATTLAQDMVSGYESGVPADDTAAVVAGDRWAASMMDVEAFFAWSNEFTIVTGEFGTPAKTRTITDHGAWDLNPALDGDQLVWTRITADGVDVVGQRGDGLGGTTVLAGGPGDQIRPDLDGDTLAWLEVGPEETDVWVRRGNAAPVNVTPEPGTQATKVRVDGDVVAWSEATWVHTVDLGTGQTQARRVPGFLFNTASDIQLTSAGLFVRVGGFFGDGIYHAAVDNLAALRKLDVGRNLYAAQFAVNEEYLAFDTTTAWGNLATPSNADLHKLRTAPVADVLAGTATWQRVSCASGAQISPAFGDGRRLVWLDTSLARTDLVTRDDWAGSC